MTDIIQYEGIENLGTTTDLINGKPIYDLDRIIETSGFTTAGDGCAGKWKQNGVTGQTPSQAPAQTGKATLNDGNGNQWELVREKNDIHLSKLGAKEGDDITDIFKAAVSEIGNNGGKIKLPYALEDNPCKISSTVTIRSDVTVYGESVFNSWLKQEDNANTNLLNAQNRDNNCFRDFSVDLNGSNNTAGNSINAGDCTKLKLINLSIKDAIKNIVLIQDCTDFNMSNVSAYGGGYYPDDNRGYELAGVENFNIKNISTKDYTGAGINLSRCNNGVLSGLNFTRDFSQGFTNGFAGVRFSNSSSNITLGDFYIDGFSRGVTVTTGGGTQGPERSNSISFSNGTINNSGYSGLWVTAEAVTSTDKTRKIAISNIFAGDSGLDAASTLLDQNTVGIINAEEVKISGLVTKGDLTIQGTKNCIISSSIINGDLTESSDDLIADKNIITSNRVLGSISTVGVNTLKENNIEGA